MDISFLYTPALRIDDLRKKIGCVSPSRVIIDLEDSVHVTMKDKARQAIEALDVSDFAAAGYTFGMRINSLRTFDGLADVQLIRSLADADKTYIDYVLVPKIKHPSEIDVLRELFAALARPPKLYAFIETVEAVDNADAIAAVSDGLCFGQADLCAEMYHPNDVFVDYARARLCIAAARHGIPAIDTNSFEVEDMAAVERACEIAKTHGFSGKAAIHPSQVEPINRVFTVTPALVEKYQASIDAYERADTGFAIRDGDVIAPPFVTKAKRMLAFYERQAGR